MSYLFTQVSYGDFLELFRQCGRESQFSNRAKIALFGSLNDLALDTGSPIELDAIALCCEWSEYPTAIEAAEEYGKTFEDEDEPEEIALEWLRNRTTVIEHGAGILMVQF